MSRIPRASLSFAAILSSSRSNASGSSSKSSRATVATAPSSCFRSSRIALRSAAGTRGAGDSSDFDVGSRASPWRRSAKHSTVHRTTYRSSVPWLARASTLAVLSAAYPPVVSINAVHCFGTRQREYSENAVHGEQVLNRRVLVRPVRCQPTGWWSFSALALQPRTPSLSREVKAWCSDSSRTYELRLYVL